MRKICYNDGMYLRKTGKLMVWIQPPSTSLGGRPVRQGLHCSNAGLGTGSPQQSTQALFSVFPNAIGTEYLSLGDYGD